MNVSKNLTLYKFSFLQVFHFSPLVTNVHLANHINNNCEALTMVNIYFKNVKSENCIVSFVSNPYRRISMDPLFIKSPSKLSFCAMSRQNPGHQFQPKVEKQNEKEKGFFKITRQSLSLYIIIIPTYCFCLRTPFSLYNF